MNGLLFWNTYRLYKGQPQYHYLHQMLGVSKWDLTYAKDKKIKVYQNNRLSNRFVGVFILKLEWFVHFTRFGSRFKRQLWFDFVAHL